jgi:hypothetical protein
LICSGTSPAKNLIVFRRISQAGGFGKSVSLLLVITSIGFHLEPSFLGRPESVVAHYEQGWAVGF